MYVRPAQDWVSYEQQITSSVRSARQRASHHCISDRLRSALGQRVLATPRRVTGAGGLYAPRTPILRRRSNQPARRPSTRSLGGGQLVHSPREANKAVNQSISNQLKQTTLARQDHRRKLEQSTQAFLAPIHHARLQAPAPTLFARI